MASNGSLKKIWLTRNGKLLYRMKFGEKVNQYRSAFLLDSDDLGRNESITNGYSPTKLRDNQRYPLSVYKDTEQNIAFKSGEPDWDAVQTKMDGDRPVISRLFNQADTLGEDSVEFTGNDKPELAKIPVEVNGETKMVQMLAVEKGSTNLVTGDGTQNVTVTAQAYTISFEGTGSIVLSGVHSATLNGIAVGRASLTFTPTAGTLTITVSGTVSNLKLETGSYPTLYHIGTRPAPAPVLPNFLPETGFIAGWVDSISDEDTNNYLFENTGDALGRTILVLHYVVERRVVFRFSGSPLVAIDNALFMNGYNERSKFGFILSWTGTTYIAYFSKATGEIYKYAGNYTPSGTQISQISLGNNSAGIFPTSNYFHQLISGTRSSFTDTEAIQLLSDMSAGYLDLKPEDFTIQ